MSAPDHRSISQHTQYKLCGEYYRRHYVEGDKREIGIAGKRGLAVDEALTASLECKIRHGKLLPTAEVAAHASREILKLKKRDVYLTRGEESSGWMNTRARVAKIAGEMATLANDTVATKMQPAATQVNLEPTIPGTDIVVKMYIDVVEKDNSIGDWKTKNRDPGKRAAEQSLQLAIYAWGARTESTPENIVRSPKQTLHCLIAPTKTMPVRYMPYSACHDEDSQNRALGALVESDYAIRQGVFMPADPDCFKCSQDYCPYYRECAFGRGVAPTQFAGFGDLTQDEIIPEADDDQMPEGDWDVSRDDPRDNETVCND